MSINMLTTATNLPDLDTRFDKTVQYLLSFIYRFCTIHTLNTLTMLNQL